MIVSMQLFASNNHLFFMYSLVLPSFSFKLISVYMQWIILWTICDVFVDFYCCQLLEHVFISTVQEFFDVAKNNSVDSSWWAILKQDNPTNCGIFKTKCLLVQEICDCAIMSQFGLVQVAFDL